MPRSNFNILDVGTRHVRTFSGTGLSYAFSNNAFDYNIYLTSFKKGADVDNKTNIIINIFFMIAPQQMETQKHQNNHLDTPNQYENQ
jgi:hypothetical protein